MLIKSILKREFCLIDLFSKYRIVALVIISFILSQSLAFSQNQVAKKSPDGTWYYEYLPADYDKNKKDYPVMFFFHGLGERGNTKGDLEKVLRNGPPMHVRKGHDFPFILISPQLKSNMGNWSANYIDEVVEHVLKKDLRIDENRVYVTGLSLGGGGAWYYAQSFPEKIAAVAPICGSGNNINKAQNIAAENIPVWAFHGDADRVVSVSKTINMINALKAYSPAMSPKPKMTIYKGVKHDSWTRAYTTDRSIHSPNLYDWFMQQSRAAISVDAGNNIKLNSSKNSTKISGSAHSSVAIKSYLWEKVSGPSVTMENTVNTTLSVSNLKSGVYQFSLTATDKENNSASDQVTVTVGESNTPPQANAGNNKKIKLPKKSISILGSGTDSDGNVTSYSWRKTSGGEATLKNTNKEKLEVSNLKAGIYKFELTVEDDKKSTHSDEMRLEVLNNKNSKPIADAGKDFSIYLPTNSTKLVGKGKVEDGHITSYWWKKMSGPSVKISNKDKPSTTIKNLKKGTYVFQLKVKDNKGATHTDQIKLKVLKSNEDSDVSVDRAKQTITLPKNSVEIRVKTSNKSRNRTTYLWKIENAPGNAILKNNNKAKLTVNKMNTPGKYIFSVTVSDGKGATTKAEAIVIVKKGKNNKPNKRPTVDAGPKQLIVLPKNKLVLKGKASDPDGEIVKYFWEKVSGGKAKLSNKNTATLKVSNLEEGNYRFRFTATDNDGARKSNAVNVRVKAEDFNILPKVKAGKNKAIKLPKDHAKFKARAFDKDGEIKNYRWKLISGDKDFSWSGKNTSSIELSRLKEGIYKFQVTVKDDRGGFASDEVRLKVMAGKSNKKNSSAKNKVEILAADQPKFEAAQLALVSDSILIENTPDNVNIRWFYEDNLQEQFNDENKIPFSTSGAYYVIFESNDYSITSEVFEFIITSNQLKIDYQSVRVYPNPTNTHYINIQSEAFNSDEINLQLVDFNGQVVQLEKVNSSQLKIGYRMELPNQLNTGIYQLRILDRGNLGVFKIVLN